MATDSVWGITMVRDEADIIGSTVAHMATQVDHVLVADNLSRDNTAAIARAAGAEVVTDPDPAYRQSEKMTALAATAREQGATWVVPFDADEIWHTIDGTRIADYLTRLTDYDVAVATLWNHWPTAFDDDSEPDPVRRIVWRDPAPGGLPKVACRTHPDLTIEMGNHVATFADHPGPRHHHGALALRHYPYRTAEQFVRKARQGGAALAATSLHRSVGAHWRQYARTLAEHGEQALVDHFAAHFYYPDPVGSLLVRDPAPVA